MDCYGIRSKSLSILMSSLRNGDKAQIIAIGVFNHQPSFLATGSTDVDSNRLFPAFETARMSLEFGSLDVFVLSTRWPGEAK